MKRLITICLAMGMILAVSGTAGAITVTFDPQALVDNWTYGPPASGTLDPRAVRDGSYTAYTGIANWNAAGIGSALDLAIRADYNSWRSGGGKVYAFNVWLDNNPAALGWGEQLLAKTDAAGANWSATAQPVAGWFVHIIPNPWDAARSLAEWYCTDAAKALTLGGVSPGSFSFSVSVVDESVPPTVWFGGYTGDVGQTPYWDSSAIEWKNASVLWQAVPEPATIGLLGLGALSLLRRKR